MKRSIWFTVGAALFASLAFPALAQNVKVHAPRRHRGRVLRTGSRTDLRGPERHPHPVRPRPYGCRCVRSTAGQDRHHSCQPHAWRPRRQCAQQGAELRHLRQPRHVRVGIAQYQCREHRRRQEGKDRHRQRDAAFLCAKLKASGGDPANSILARFGGSVTVGGIRIATVTALHSNGLDPDYIGGELGKAMKEAGIAGDVGLATGYVLTFSNGLPAYLSGDTGIVADQEAVVRDYYHAKLAVMISATASPPGHRRPPT